MPTSWNLSGKDNLWRRKGEPAFLTGKAGSRYVSRRKRLGGKPQRLTLPIEFGTADQSLLDSFLGVKEGPLLVTSPEIGEDNHTCDRCVGTPQ
jgi:hypothetical protein